MNNLFLSGLNSEQRMRLEAADIGCLDLTLGDEQGVIVEENQLESVLRTLDCIVVSQSAMPFEGLKKVVLKVDQHLPEDNADPSVSSDAELEGSSLAQVAKQVLLPLLRRDIVLHRPRTFSVPVNDGKFHIHISSSPQKCVTGVKPPERIWGVPVDCRDYGWPASGTGVAFPNDEGTYQVAELVGADNLYIHHDLARNGTVNEEKILRILLNKVLTHLALPRERWLAYHRQQMIEECSKCSVKSLAQVPSEQQPDRVKEMKKELAKRVRAGQTEEAKILRDEGLSKEVFGQEYEALLRVPKVKDVQVSGNSIVVYTDLLKCKDNRTGHLHEIGAFKIELPMLGASPLWFNQTRLVHGYQDKQHAPHVFANGTACLGNTADLFAKLLKERQFAIAAQLAIEFVEQANTSDTAGKHIDRWPRAR